MSGVLTQLILATLLGPTNAPPARGSEAEFIGTMQRIQRDARLAPMARFDSKHFVAISNAADDFSRERLKLCEHFQDAFLRHFERKGFAVAAPVERHMIAIFDSNEGFDAYFGRKMNGTLGVYHPQTNRLILYDFSQNRQIRGQREALLEKGGNLGNSWQRQKYEQSVSRKIDDYTNDVNLSVTMHECAHLVSFNCGLLNRTKDVPAWLAEGLAAYCEATNGGDWTALGSPNPMRIRDLQRANGNLIELTDLVRQDRWVQSSQVLTGYAQSWALFHMLMTERPKELRRYLDLIRERRTSESRLADFQEAFGDLRRTEARYAAYRRDMIAHAAR